MLGIIGGNFGKWLSTIALEPALVYDIDANKTNCSIDVVNASCSHVLIATPNNTHFQEIMKWLDRRKHVLCLKPFLFTPDEIDIAFEKAYKQGVILKAGFNQRYRREVNAAISVELEHFDFIWQSSIIRHAPFASMKYDLGSHLIDLMLRMFPSVNINSILDKRWHNYQLYRVRTNQGMLTAKTGESMLWCRFFGIGNSTFKLKEVGDVSTWKDAYTFQAMIDDFLQAKMSDDPGYLKKLAEVLS